MSIESRRRAIMRSGSGGGIKTASGTITIGSDYNNTVITHNLGTSKVFGMIWLEPNENDEVITVAAYQTIFSTFVTWERQREIYAGTTLVSNYTSSETKTAAWPDFDIGAGITIGSDFSNKAASWKTSRGTLKGEVIDDNSVRIYYVGTGGPYTRHGTYHWQVWALE